MIGLVTETKVRDDLAVAFEVGALEVVEKSLAPADHLEQSTPAVMILGVSAEVVVEVVDVLGENRYLDLGRARVGAMRAVLFDCRGLLKCHVAVLSARGARWFLL
jgi:hypothetical protein